MGRHQQVVQVLCWVDKCVKAKLEVVVSNLQSASRNKLVLVNWRQSNLKCSKSYSRDRLDESTRVLQGQERDRQEARSSAHVVTYAAY